MPLSAAQLNAYLADEGVISADQLKLSADQATENSDSDTIAAGLPPTGQAVLSPDGTSVSVFTPVIGPPPTFAVATYPIAT